MKRIKVYQLPSQDSFPEREILINILKDKINGAITQEEFMGTLLSWSYEYAFSKGDYLPEQIPYKPIRFAPFEQMSKEDWKNLNETVKEKYLEDRMKWKEETMTARNKNKVHKEWLLKMLSFYTYKGDVVKKIEINNRINLYEGAC